MEFIDSFNINRIDYDVNFLRNTGINEVTSLSNLPVNKRMIHATLSGPSVLSVQNGMEVGEGLIVICECTAEFKLQFNSDSKYKFIGDNGINKPIYCQNETMFKIYITKSSDSGYTINLSRTFKEIPMNFILVSTDSSRSVNWYKRTNSHGSSTEKIIIPAGSNNYKIDGVIYGFYTTYDSHYYPNITSYDLSNFDTSNVTNMSNMFEYCDRLNSLNLSNFDTSNVTNMSNMFNYCSSLDTLDLSNFDTSNVTNMNSMFGSCMTLDTDTLDLSNFDTSNVTDMGSMFGECTSLTSLNLSNFDTSKVTDMGSMFADCSQLTSLNLSSFDTSKVTDMGGMFAYCSQLTSLNLSNFDTSNVTDMGSMFSSCGSLKTLDISNFDTSKVTDMGSMFANCDGLTSLDLSNFDTINVTSMNGMFGGCSKLNHIKCKQAFKDWCWYWGVNQDTIGLPDAMRPNGGGQWEIVP